VIAGDKPLFHTLSAEVRQNRSVKSQHVHFNTLPVYHNGICNKNLSTETDAWQLFTDTFEIYVFLTELM